MSKKKKRTKKNLEVLAKVLIGIGTVFTGLAELIKALR